MKVQWIAAAAAAGVLAVAPQAYGQTPDTVQDPARGASAVTSTEQFVEKAAVSNLFEIESSMMALERAQNERVREFAEQMIEDHTKAGADLEEALAQSGGGISAPQELDAAHQQKLEELEAASEDSFDAEYVRMQMAAHDEAVALFSAYAESGDDEAVRQFARLTLPTLEAHKESVHQLSQTIGS